MKYRKNMDKRNFSANRQFLFLIFISVLILSIQAFAQTTAFTYQGRLTDAGTPPTGNYDFQFTLYDAGAFVFVAIPCP